MCQGTDVVDHPIPLVAARRHPSQPESRLQRGVTIGGAGRSFVIERGLVQPVPLEFSVGQPEQSRDVIGLQPDGLLQALDLLLSVPVLLLQECLAIRPAIVVGIQLCGNPISARGLLKEHVCMVSHAEFANCFGRAGPPPRIPIRIIQQGAKARVRCPEIRQLWEALGQSYRKQDRRQQPRDCAKRYDKSPGL